MENETISRAILSKVLVVYYKLSFFKLPSTICSVLIRTSVLHIKRFRLNEVFYKRKLTKLFGLEEEEEMGDL
jgi:hypothetical protein